MKIDEAIKREKVLFKIFIISMIIIGIALPMALLITRIFNLVYIVFLLIIEFLIVIAILNKINMYRLSFKYNNNKLIFAAGLSSSSSLLLCDKVEIVHTNKYDYDIEIIIVTSFKAKNKYLRPINEKFLKRYPVVRKQYEKLLLNNNGRKYYFQIIRRGGLKKYLLLDLIYRCCVRAVYTDKSIQSIKIARGQVL